ncbi:MAG: hypothetical protein PUI98_07035 [Finegoldia magna]|nr:hypothetical protein [Finegoldia magna]
MKQPQTVISKKDLAKRWSVREEHISTLEAKGILTRTEIGRCTYPMEQVNSVEKSGRTVALEEEVFMLRQENINLKDNIRRLKSVIKSITQTF